MIELVFIRHGESVRNFACRLAHAGDLELLDAQLKEEPSESSWPLTDAGRMQAFIAGRWVKANIEPVQAVYCSPYVRTLQTAEELDLGLDPILDERLKEREWGEYEVGHYTAREYLQDLTCCGSFEWRTKFPNGQSISDLVPTSREFLDEVLLSRSEGRYAIVTHGGRMIAFEHLIENQGSSRKHTNCCVVNFRIDGDSVSVRTAYPAQPEIPFQDWADVRATAAV